MLVNEEPKYCYADRMDSVEQISFDDSVKMGLFGGLLSDEEFRTALFRDLENDDFFPEFKGDVKFNPSTGKKLSIDGEFTKLHDWQRMVMNAVISKREKNDE